MSKENDVSITYKVGGMEVDPQSMTLKQLKQVQELVSEEIRKKILAPVGLGATQSFPIYVGKDIIMS